MPESMVVEIEVLEANAAAKLQNLAALIQNLTAKTQGLTSQVQQAVNAYSQMRIPGMGSGGGAGGGGGGSVPALPKNPFASGPAARLQAALDNLAKAMAHGNAIQKFDAQSNYQRALKSFNSAQGAMGPSKSPFWNAVKGAISSSRVSVSGGGIQVMPLVNKVLKVISTLGPYGEALAIVVSAAIAGFVIAGAAAMYAANAMKQFATAMYTGGGTARETAGLSATGAALGLSTTDMASMARSFADGISHGGIGASYASKMGVHDYGIFDTTDKSGKLMRFMEGVMKLDNHGKNRSEALRAMRSNPGTEALAPMLDWNDKTKSLVKKLQSEQEKLYTPEMINMSQQFNAQLGILQARFEGLMIRVGLRVIPWLIKFTDALSDFMDWVINSINRLRKAAGMDPLATGPDAHAIALDRNTEATEENTRATRAGISGGGENARNAAPRGWTGGNVGNWAGEAAKMGAFAL